MLRLMIMEEADENHRINQIRIARKRLRDTQNAFEIPETTFQKLYLLPKCLLQALITDLEPYMRVAKRNTSIPNHIQVLAFVSSVTNGSYQKIVGHDTLLGLSQTSMSRCIDLVGRAIDEILAPIYIKFPQNENTMNSIKRIFYDKFGFPGIIGAIKCTHFVIQKPSMDENEYYNDKKQAHTKNVEIICNYDLRILSINARYGGNASDMFVWSNGQANRFMENIYKEGNTNTWLIGDSEYEQKPWLMTPIRNPSSPSEEDYNAKHRQARYCIHRCIRVLKNNFKILGKDRILRYSPQKSEIIITACAVLHNIMIINKVPGYAEWKDETEMINNTVTTNDK